MNYAQSYLQSAYSGATTGLEENKMTEYAAAAAAAAQCHTVTSAMHPGYYQTLDLSTRAVPPHAHTLASTGGLPAGTGLVSVTWVPQELSKLSYTHSYLYYHTEHFVILDALLGRCFVS